MYNSISNSDIKKWKNKIEKTVEAETYLGDEKNHDNNVKCDKTLPFCLYNNEEKNINKNSKFIVHKMNHEIKLYDNYFFEETNNKNNDDINDYDYINSSQDSLMVQRQKHICP